MARRPISEEERALWQLIARTATPLKRRRKSEPKPPPSPEPPAPKLAKPKTKPSPPKAPTPVAPPPVRPHELSHGKAVGIDKRQAERFRRGKTPIEGKIDLHGRTQQEAHDDLHHFVARAHASGKRMVLVITGKGITGSKSGVLRENVPRWLNEPTLRRHVLAFDYAEPQHGGEGALYVLLKRKK
ncbi:Smr/MutS family protein [Dongia sp.]|uniref:Smr/MutS family protein n=1 Tax=Dongia sp. TaxID=1977262 RepID=UPI003752FDDC